VVDRELQARELEALAVLEFLDVVRFGELVVTAQQHPRTLGADPGHRVAQQVPVVGVDPGGAVVRAADREDREHVVDVAVREQYGDRLQFVLAHDLLDTRGGVLSGVDHDAFRALAGGDDVAVRAPRTRGEPGDEHDRPSWNGSGPPKATGHAVRRSNRRTAAAGARFCLIVIATPLRSGWEFVIVQ
jgi:hypothetical protein